MDVCSLTEVTPRPTLITSEKNNVVLANSKARTREITSRYRSGIPSAPSSAPSTPIRCPSPNASRTLSTPGASVPKRAQSADRRRPSTPSTRPSTPSSPLSRASSPSSRLSRASSPSSRPSTPSSPSLRSITPVHDSIAESQNSSRRLLGGRDGLWPSIRSLSSSFQSDYSSPLASKRDKIFRNPSPERTVKSSASAISERKRTPLRGRNNSDQSENSRPVENSHSRMIDHHRWPGIGKMGSRALSKSMDLTDKVNRSASLSNPTRGLSPTRRMPMSDTVGGSLQRSVNEAARRLSSDGSKMLECGISAPPERALSVSKMSDTVSGSLQRSVNEAARRLSSDGSKMLECGISAPPERALSVSKMSDTVGSSLQRSVNEAARRLSSDGSKMLECGISAPPERALSVTRPSRTQSLPVPGLHRPSTPSKTLQISSSASRRMQSPSRTRPSTPVSPTSSTASRMGVPSSILNYFADVRTGKKSANHMEDVHQLRLLYNRDLQWHFVNAQADAALSTQKITTENSLYDVWSITSELHDSVFVKRINMQKLKQEMILDLILKEQIAYLEQWTSLEKEHSSCLSGAFESLKASTLHLPVTGGAKADVRAVKNSVSSAVDVMQAMGSSICYLLSRVEGTNRLVLELCNIAAKERAMLDECRELLASTVAMQVQECTLRAHLMQLTQDVA